MPRGGGSPRPSGPSTACTLVSSPGGTGHGQGGTHTGGPAAIEKAMGGEGHGGRPQCLRPSAMGFGGVSRATEALGVQQALPGCCAVARWEREGSSCPPSPPPKHRPGDRQSRAALWPPAGEAAFSSVNFRCPGLSSGRLPCVAAPPPTPRQRGARLAHGSGLPPCRLPGTEAGQPQNLSGLKITPSCMCFCNFSYWKSHSETLFVKKKKPSEIK